MAVLRQAEHAFLMCGGTLLDKGPIDRISGCFENRCIPCDHTNMPAPGEAAVMTADGDEVTLR